MTQYAYILKSPGEPDEVFTETISLMDYLTVRYTSYAITGSELTLQRVLTDGTIIATIEKVRLNPETFVFY